MSLFPIRCFTCGKVLANKLGAFLKCASEGGMSDAAKVNSLDKLKLDRICCRRMFLSYDEKLEMDINKYDTVGVCGDGLINL